MKNLKITILLFAVAAMASCKKGNPFCYKEDGNITTEERTVSGFSEITLCTSADVYVEQATVQSVIVETSSNLQDIIQIKVKGNTLEIDTRKGKCIKGDPILNVYVKTPDINALRISGSGNIIAAKTITTTNIDLKISGSGDIELDSLNAGSLDMIISGSGNIRTESTNTSQNQDVRISGSGDVISINSQVNEANISISGSGSCKVWVKDNLDVSISGSGDVIYKGTPYVHSSISGSGEVKPY